MSNNIYRFTPSLSSDLLNLVDDSFRESNPSFVSFLESIVNESDKLRRHSPNNKQSKGHNRIYELYKELYPDIKIEQNVTLPVTIDDKRLTIEFDIVNFTHKVIIEIQGEHHNKFVPYFHKTIDGFQRQKKRDMFKERWAEENGWILIQIKDTCAKTLDNIKQLSIILKEGFDLDGKR